MASPLAFSHPSLHVVMQSDRERLSAFRAVLAKMHHLDILGMEAFPVDRAIPSRRFDVIERNPMMLREWKPTPGAEAIRADKSPYERHERNVVEFAHRKLAINRR